MGAFSATEEPVFVVAEMLTLWVRCRYAQHDTQPADPAPESLASQLHQLGLHKTLLGRRIADVEPLSAHAHLGARYTWILKAGQHRTCGLCGKYLALHGGAVKYLKA